MIINAARPLPEEGNEVCDQSNWHRALERPLREQLYHKLYPGARLRQLHPRQHRGFPQPQPAVRAGSLRDGAVREPPGGRGPPPRPARPRPRAGGRPGREGGPGAGAAVAPGSRSGAGLGLGGAAPPHLGQGEAGLTFRALRPRPPRDSRPCACVTRPAPPRGVPERGPALPSASPQK